MGVGGWTLLAVKAEAGSPGRREPQSMQAADGTFSQGGGRGGGKRRGQILNLFLKVEPSGFADRSSYKIHTPYVPLYSHLKG